VESQLREAELEVSDDTAEDKGDLRPCPSLPLPLAEAADVIYTLPPANVVSVALTEFWHKFSDVRPVLEVKYVDIFGPHKSVKNFLDCTQSTKIIGEMLKNGGCTWLPSNESFTAKHRPAAKTQLISGELVITRHREDVELRTNCHAVRITFEKKLPFVVLGTHEVDAESFADAECITDLIKLHQEVIVKRYRQITVVYHGVTHPGPKCGVTLHKVQSDKIAVAIKWSLSTVRHAIANRRTLKSSVTSFKRFGQWSQTLAKPLGTRCMDARLESTLKIRPSTSEMI